MRTFRATAAGPWGPLGSEFHRKETDHQIDHYLKNGVLVEVDTYAGMSAKERAVARAEALGLDTKGTTKAIEKRIEEHEASLRSPEAVETTPTEPGGEAAPTTAPTITTT